MIFLMGLKKINKCLLGKKKGNKNIPGQKKKMQKHKAVTPQDHWLRVPFSLPQEKKEKTANFYLFVF